MKTQIEILWIIKREMIFLVSLLSICVLSIYITRVSISYIDDKQSVTDLIYYRGVQSSKDNFEIYKDIVFKSDSVVYEDINVIWQDILRCDLYDGLWYRYYSYYESKARLSPKDYTSIWVWQGEKPTVPAKCYLDGLVVVTTDLWNTKNLHISSNEFTIWVK